MRIALFAPFLFSLLFIGCTEKQQMSLPPLPIPTPVPAERANRLASAKLKAAKWPGVEVNPTPVRPQKVGRKTYEREAGSEEITPRMASSTDTSGTLPGLEKEAIPNLDAAPEIREGTKPSPTPSVSPTPASPSEQPPAPRPTTRPEFFKGIRETAGAASFYREKMLHYSRIYIFEGGDRNDHLGTLPSLWQTRLFASATRKLCPFLSDTSKM